MSAFDVDLTTGILSYDDSIHATDAELINGGKNLLVDGIWNYTLNNGHVLVDDDYFTYPDRGMNIKGSVILTSGKVIPFNTVCSFRSDFNVSTAFLLGVTGSASFALVLSNENREWDRGSDNLEDNSLDGAIVNIEISAGGGYRSFGWYVVERVQNLEHMPTITLYGSDYMSTKCMKEYTDFSSAQYTAGVFTHEILERACSQAGVTIEAATMSNVFDESNTVDTKPVFENPPTCRDIIGWIAGSKIHCANVIINRDGELEFKPPHSVDTLTYILGTPPYEITPDLYTELSENVPVTEMNFALTIREYNGERAWRYTRDYFENAPYLQMEMEGSPFIDYDDAAELANIDTIQFAAVVGYIRGATSAGIKWRGNVVEPFDTVKVTRPNGTYIYIPITQQTVVFNLGLSMRSGFDLKSATLSTVEKLPLTYS